MSPPACHIWTCCAQQHQPCTCSNVCTLAFWKADAGADCCLLLLSPSSATVLTLASLCMMGEGGATLPRLWDLSSGCQLRTASVRTSDRGCSTAARLDTEADLRQGHAEQQDYRLLFKACMHP